MRKLNLRLSSLPKFAELRGVGVRFPLKSDHEAFLATSVTRVREEAEEL